MKNTTSGKGSSQRTSSKKSTSSETTLADLFEEELKDILGAERQLTKALPKLAKAATTEDLREAIEKHLEQTEEQVSRLEKVFELCELKPQAKKCEAMEGLIEEANNLISENEKGIVLDSGLIIAAQKVEHYEIATYGSLRTL